jgi:hypothetical protein
MSIKAKTHNLNKPEDGNYGKQFNYICKDHDVQTCFQPNFFDTLAGNFMAGDTIRCLKIVKERVTHMCEGVVLSVNIDGNKREVDFRPIVAKIMTFPEVNYLHDNDQKLEEKESHEEYIKKDGVAKYNKKTRQYEVFVDDIIVYASQNKKFAEEVARGDKAIPERPKK